MQNKLVGIMVVIFALIIGLITFSFNHSFSEMAKSSCTDLAQGLSCPIQNSLDFQTKISISLILLIGIIGLYLIFFSKEEKIVVRKIREGKETRKIDLSELKSEEKQVLKMVQESGAAFQADLIEKTGFGKAKMSRIIDRLEGRGIVERKRRGMTNVVVLK